MSTLLLIALCATPDREPAEILVEANTAYDSGSYTRATELYQTLIDNGHYSGPLFYNLGNAHLRSGRLGAAIAAFLQSQSLMPRSSEVRANLEFARNSVKDAIEREESTPILHTLFFWHYRLSERELFVALMIANLLFWLCLGVAVFRPMLELWRWMTLAFLIGVVALGASVIVHTFSHDNIAVVAAYEVEVHSGLSPDAVVRFVLHEGAETELVEVQGEWARLKLPDGNQGWVPRSEIIVLTL